MFETGEQINNERNSGADVLFEYGRHFQVGEELKKEQFEEEFQRTKKEFADVGKSKRLSQNFNAFKTRVSEEDAEYIKAIREKTLGMLEENDPELEVVMASRADMLGGRWSADTLGRLGVSDFVFDTLGSKCEPATVARLGAIMKTIPSLEYAKFENMRIDAYRISHVVIDGRSFIHDHAPEARRLIVKMIEYYDAQDDEDKLKEKKEELVQTLEELRRQYGSGYNDKHENYMFDLDNYDKIIEEKVDDPIGGIKGEDAVKIYSGKTENVKVIDILRKLKDEMEPVPLVAPETKSSDLNEALRELGEIRLNEQTGEVQIDLGDLRKVMVEMNKVLIEGQGKREMFPSTISAVLFVDKLSCEALKRMTKKDWEGAVFDPTFKEIVRFSQLTSSGNYSESEFERFYDGFSGKMSQAFGEDGVDDEIIEDGYRILGTRTVNNVKEVASRLREIDKKTVEKEVEKLKKVYDAEVYSMSFDEYVEFNTKRLEQRKGGIDTIISGLWSGNLAHELIGLSELW